MLADAEGGTKVVSVQVGGAGGVEQALAVARRVADSPLVKTAVYGGDPNWGRVLQAAGTAGVGFDPGAVRLEVAGGRGWPGSRRRPGRRSGCCWSTGADPRAPTPARPWRQGDRAPAPPGRDRALGRGPDQRPDPRVRPAQLGVHNVGPAGDGSGPSPPDDPGGGLVQGRLSTTSGQGGGGREALPWIKRLSGCTVVVKYGGAAMGAAGFDAFVDDVVLLRYVGVDVIVVHGGGPRSAS